MWGRLSSKQDKEAARVQAAAVEARLRAERARASAKQAADDARQAAKQATELGRYAAAMLADQAKQLRGPAREAASRVRDTGIAAWGRRDEATDLARRAGTAASRIGHDLTEAAMERAEHLRPHHEKKHRSKAPFLLVGAAVAAGIAAVTTIPKLRSQVQERLRQAPDMAKRAPQQARTAAESAVHQARTLADSATRKAKDLTAEAEAISSKNGHDSASAASMMTAVPRAIRNRFRESVEEGKREAKETESEMKARFEDEKRD